MKQETNFKTAPRRTRSGSFALGLCKLLFGMLLTGFLTSHAAAQAVTNYFTDGFGSSTLDQYPGVGGVGIGGWQSAWTSNSTAGTFVTPVEVVSDAPLNSGGNYLRWKVGGTSRNTGSLWRQIDNTGPVDLYFHPYTVEWDFRHDAYITATSTNTTLAAAAAASPAMTGVRANVGFQYEGSSPVTGDVDNKVAFWIKSQQSTTATIPSLATKTWSFFDGSIINTKDTTGLWVNSTNLTAEMNTVYHFKVIVHPGDHLYEASVTNVASGVGFDTTIATGRKLKWQNAIASGTDFIGTRIFKVLSSQNSALTTNQLSLDNLAIQLLPADLWPPVITNLGSGKFQTIAQPAFSTFISSGRTFYRYDSNFVFIATTWGTNTLPLSGAQLTLNGVNVSGGLTATGTDADQQRIFTYSGLKNNYNYTNATITVADAAGRTGTQVSFFDTFDTNTAVIIEAENWNFNPDTNTFTTCDTANQTDGIRPDRFLQNWVYGGLNVLGVAQGGPFVTNAVDSYYQRKGEPGVDFVGGSATGANFRSTAGCAPGIGTRNEASDDYNRVGEWTDQNHSGLFLRENIIGNMGTNAGPNMWLNYTHVWQKTNYIAYLRAGSGQAQGPQTASVTNWVYELSEVVESVTSSYTNSTQSSNVLARFNVPNRLRTLTLYNNPLVDASGYVKILPLDGKKTLKLAVTSGDAASANQSTMDYMVFLPVPDITISNIGISGSDLSFSFNSIENARYIVQTNTSVTGGTWGNFTTVIGNGGQAVVHHNPINPASAPLYYRVTTP